jgi:UDPglucose--hexose-1-phosphate uridylyltransferase
MNKQIERLLAYALDKQLIQKADVEFSRNLLLATLKVESPFEGELLNNEIPQAPEDVMQDLLDKAVAAGILEDTLTQRDLWDAKLMGLLMARPSEVVRQFNEQSNMSIQSATDQFYKLAIDSNYIRMDRIRSNLYWKSMTSFGDLEITINLSKPEKDPREIAAERNAPKSNYPLCLLCSSNVGYEGRINHPARQNLRILPLTLNDEQWYFQYSPYVYYNEHCIVFHKDHVPMKITPETFKRLLDFVTIIPHYFVGSNADLPIVGGSILTHDHFQGGNHQFSMQKAENIDTYSHPNYPNVEVANVKWPLSVVRLTSADKDALHALASDLLPMWQQYSDETCGIKAFTVQGQKRIPHNTITPVCFRDEAGNYVLDLVLRNNRTTDSHPYGLFHPEERLHHIKKENIGLIEVMGLAVLPGRLVSELTLISEHIARGAESSDIANNHDHPLHKHLAWMEELKLGIASDLDMDGIQQFIRHAVGQKFGEVLEACGVFKDNEVGRKGWCTFFHHCGMQKTI